MPVSIFKESPATRTATQGQCAYRIHMKAEPTIPPATRPRPAHPGVGTWEILDFRVCYNHGKGLLFLLVEKEDSMHMYVIQGMRSQEQPELFVYILASPVIKEWLRDFSFYACMITSKKQRKRANISLDVDIPYVGLARPNVTTDNTITQIY